jgi:hypothetical protein
MKVLDVLPMTAKFLDGLNEDPVLTLPPFAAIKFRIKGLLPSLCALVRTPRPDDFCDQRPSLPELVDALGKLKILAPCPLPLFQSAGNGIVPTLATVFVCTPRKLCSNAAPIFDFTFHHLRFHFGAKDLIFCWCPFPWLA